MGLYAPDPPDNSALVKANSQIAKESLNFQREQAAIANQRAQELMTIVKTEVARSQGFADERARQAREEQTRYDTIYAPLQEKQAREADAYLTPQRVAQARAQQAAIDARTAQTTADSARLSSAANDKLAQAREFAPVNTKLAREAIAATDPALDAEARARQAEIDARYGYVGVLGGQAGAASSRLRSRYDSEYVPIEQRLNADALGYDTPARREAMAGRAISDVSQALSAEREAAQRRLEGFGVDPSMLRSGALDLQYRIGGAAAKAQVGTDARQRVEDIGYARMSDAAARGAGVRSAADSTGALAGSMLGAAAEGYRAPTQQAINADRAFGKLGAATEAGGALYNSGVAGAQAGANLGQLAVANKSLRDRVSAEEDVRRALLADTVNTGRGFASAVGGSYAQAIDSGRAAASTAGSGAGTATQISQAAGDLYRNPIAANSAASNMMYERAAAQQAAWPNSFGGFLSNAIPTIAGGALGGYMGFLSEGGRVPDSASPSHGAVVDDVPARVRGGPPIMLDGGEYVVPRDVVEWKGQEFFERLKHATRKQRTAIPEA